MNQKYRQSKPSHRTESRQTLAILVGAGLLLWLFLGAYVVGQLEIKTTKLILNQGGCTLLQSNGIKADIRPETGNCAITLPFRPNLVNAGGRVRIGDITFNLPEHQVIAYSILTDQPYTDDQWELIYWLSGATFLLLFLAFSDVIFSRKKE